MVREVSEGATREENVPNHVVDGVVGIVRRRRSIEGMVVERERVLGRREESGGGRGSGGEVGS